MDGVNFESPALEALPFEEIDQESIASCPPHLEPPVSSLYQYLFPHRFCANADISHGYVHYGVSEGTILFES